MSMTAAPSSRRLGLRARLMAAIPPEPASPQVSYSVQLVATLRRSALWRS
jgi:hypothetical protein